LEDKWEQEEEDEHEVSGWEMDALCLPPESLKARPTRLNARERYIVRRKIQEVKGVARQRALIAANEPPETCERAKDYSNRIIQSYKDTVLTGKVLPDPPVRGPYGYAYVPLKEGAKPFRAKPIRLHGKKERAYS
jgi:hypothetical protein